MNNLRRFRVLILPLLVIWLGFCSHAGLAAEPNPAFGQPGWFSAKTDLVLDKVADVLQKKIRELAGFLNNRQSLDLKITQMFYDRHLRRMFVEYDGAVRFTGKWPSKFDKDEYYFTSDGNLAWDFTLRDLRVEKGAITFTIKGDLVISLDKIMFELASEISRAATMVAWYQASDALLVFFQKLDCDLVARSITKTLGSFSRESAAVMAGELIDNSSRPSNPEFRRRVKEAMEDGSVVTYFALTLIKNSASSFAGIGGATLGGLVGNLVVPGAGGVVGAYLGSKIFSTMAKTVVYKLSVDWPTKLCLRQIVKHGRDLQNQPRNEVSSRGLERITTFVNNRVKHELDREEYKTFDLLLAAMNEREAADRAYFAPLLRSFQDMLRFKVIEEKDWYASKKFYQLKQRVVDWGLLKQVPF